MTELKPEAYQQEEVKSQKSKIKNQKSDVKIPQYAVRCKYVLKDNTVKFDVGDYDKSKILVIDPQLIFSTYSGSLADNWGFTATFDNDNNVYSGGLAFGVGYPVTTGAYQQKFGGDTIILHGEWI